MSLVQVCLFNQNLENLQHKIYPKLSTFISRHYQEKKLIHFAGKYIGKPKDNAGFLFQNNTIANSIAFLFVQFTLPYPTRSSELFIVKRFYGLACSVYFGTFGKAW